jgi:ferredoxin
VSRAQPRTSQPRSNQPRSRAQPRELAVNPIACQAHGVCIELLPERISADPWGYPVLAPGPVPPDLLSLAQRAVNSCPTLALRLRATMSPEPPQRPSS